MKINKQSDLKIEKNFVMKINYRHFQQDQHHLI